MTPPSLPAEVFDALPPAVQAYIRYLEGRLADLEARLGQTSANSSKPPSSDPPHAKPAPSRTPSGRRKGGQPGHPKRTRPDLPPDTVVELHPGTCDRCSHPLVGDDPEPLRHQVVEFTSHPPGRDRVSTAPPAVPELRAGHLCNPAGGGPRRVRAACASSVRAAQWGVPGRQPRERPREHKYQLPANAGRTTP